MESRDFPDSIDSSVRPRKPGAPGLIGVYLVFAALVARTFTSADVGTLLRRYLGLESLFLVLFTAAWWRPRSPGWLIHVYFAVQSSIVLVLLSFNPEFDFVVLLFFLLSYQASLFFDGRVRWAWVVSFVLLTGGSLIAFLGPLRGLALALTTMAAEVVVAAFVIVNQETESAKAKSQSLVRELSETNRQLQLYAGQVEGMAAVQERDRLAMALRDRVSQMIFSISLTARSAQLLLEREPSRVPAELGRLQSMTAEALSQLRLLISQLRPPQEP